MFYLRLILKIEFFTKDILFSCLGRVVPIHGTKDNGFVGLYKLPVRNNRKEPIFALNLKTGMV